LRESTLVTGSAGFIGSNLIQQMLSNGEKVVCLDNFDSFYSTKIKVKNIRPFMQDKNFCLKIGDVRNQELLKKILKRQNVSSIVHLAARPGVAPSLQNPLLYEEINVDGTLSVLLTCANRKIPKLVFASSSSVYGQGNGSALKEDMPLMPISPYGSTKMSAEKHCQLFSKLHGINIACLRFFTVYGPRQRPDMAIYKFTKAILRGKPIIMYNEGKVKRDFTCIFRMT